MPSMRKQALDALKTVLTAKMATLTMPAGWPGAPAVRRRTASLIEASAAGDVVIPLGRLEFEAVEFGSGAGAIYEHRLTVNLEVYAAHADEEVRVAALDAISEGVGAAIAADRSLGGVVDDTELASADAEELGDEGTAGESGALIPIVLTWHAPREHA